MFKRICKGIEKISVSIWFPAIAFILFIAFAVFGLGGLISDFSFLDSLYLGFWGGLSFSLLLMNAITKIMEEKYQ